MEKSLPKAKKLPDMKDFQLFNHRRIAELYEAEHNRELKRARALQARTICFPPADQHRLCKRLGAPEHIGGSAL